MGSAEAGGAGLDTALVLEQLQRILDSKDFDASERNRRFLRYVVQEMLAGRGERIKAYNIATSVFDRDESFDPQTDPIVRIEASRLRRSLDRYYLTAGRDDTIRITIPKGSYAPSVVESGTASQDSTPPSHEAPRAQRTRDGFSRKPLNIATAAFVALVMAVGGILWTTGYFAQPTVPPRTESSSRGPAILVFPFENNGGSSQQNELARGFTREVVTGLTRFNDLFVFGPETSFLYQAGTDISKITSELGVDFILTGGVTTTPAYFRVTTSLLDARSGQYVWSDRFVEDLAAVGIHAMRDKIADQVVHKLAQPYGVIFNEKAKEIEGRPAESMTSYECVLRFYQYWRSYRVERHEPVRECLEHTVATDRSYADAYASLAIVYVDAYRFSFGRESLSFDPMERAQELAQRAIELAPDSSFSYHAMHLVYWLMGEVDLSLAAGERGLQLNPHNTNLMADLGLRYGDRAQWDRGLPLLEEAYARNPGQPGQYRIAFVLKHYVDGDYEEALAQAKQLDAPDVAIAHVALAICYGQLGRTEEAKAAVAKILAIDPTYGARALEDLRMRNVHEDYIPLILDGLAKAGMVIPGYPRDAS